MLIVWLHLIRLSLPKIREISPKTTFHNVYNGFVEDEINLGKNVDQLSDCFRIGYAGTIYPYNRVEDFLEGLKLFVTMNPNANFQTHVAWNTKSRKSAEKN